MISFLKQCIQSYLISKNYMLLKSVSIRLIKQNLNMQRDDDDEIGIKRIKLRDSRLHVLQTHLKTSNIHTACK